MTTSALSDLREALREQVDYRGLLYEMTARDLRLRYKQTIMGFGWAIFMPVVNTALFSVIFTKVAPVQTPVPYPVFAFCGLLAWNFLASSLKFSVTSLTSNANLIGKVYFPREIFPISAVLVCLVDFAVASLVLAGLIAWNHLHVGLAVLLLPVVLAVHVAFTVGLAYLLSMSNLFFRDVKYVFEIVITIAMFTTSTLYPVDAVGGRMGLLMRWNPMTVIIEGYRDVLLYDTLPALGPFAIVAIGSVALLLWGWLVFHRAEFQFAEKV